MELSFRQLVTTCTWAVDPQVVETNTWRPAFVSREVNAVCTVERHPLDRAAGRERRADMQGTDEARLDGGCPRVPTVGGCDVNRACPDPDICFLIRSTGLAGRSGAPRVAHDRAGVRPRAAGAPPATAPRRSPMPGPVMSVR